VLLADTLQALLARLSTAIGGVTADADGGTVLLGAAADGTLQPLALSSAFGGVGAALLTMPAPSFAFTSPAPESARLIRNGVVFVSRLRFTNLSAGVLFGQVFAQGTAIASGTVPQSVVKVPANDAAEIVYRRPTSRFFGGAIMAFSSTQGIYTPTGAAGLLEWDEYPDLF
jgi:hypothetical protein